MFIIGVGIWTPKHRIVSIKGLHFTLLMGPDEQLEKLGGYLFNVLNLNVRYGDITGDDLNIRFWSKGKLVDRLYFYISWAKSNLSYTSNSLYIVILLLLIYTYIYSQDQRSIYFLNLYVQPRFCAHQNIHKTLTWLIVMCQRWKAFIAYWSRSLAEQRSI